MRDAEFNPTIHTRAEPDDEYGPDSEPLDPALLDEEEDEAIDDEEDNE